MTTLFDQIGGDRLRAVLDDFYDRVMADVMIGFLFFGKDKTRLVEKEWEFAARLLGADVPYTGKGIRAAHARSPILGGHFERRLQLLRETLADHHVPAEVCSAWIAHTEKLRHLVTSNRGSECIHEGSAGASQGRRLPIVDSE